MPKASMTTVEREMYERIAELFPGSGCLDKRQVMELIGAASYRATNEFLADVPCFCFTGQKKMYGRSDLARKLARCRVDA